MTKLKNRKDVVYINCFIYRIRNGLIIGSALLISTLIIFPMETKGSEEIATSSETTTEYHEITVPKVIVINCESVSGPGMASIKEATPPVPENVYTPVFNNLSAEDIDYWAKSLYLETADSSWECKVATAEIYCNRVISGDDWGNTIREVIDKKGQFSTTKNIRKVTEGARYSPYGDSCVDLQPYRDVIEYVRQNGNTMLDTHYIYFATYKANGHNFIKIGGHYFSTK